MLCASADLPWFLYQVTMLDWQKQGHLEAQRTPLQLKPCFEQHHAKVMAVTWSLAVSPPEACLCRLSSLSSCTYSQLLHINERVGSPLT